MAVGRTRRADEPYFAGGSEYRYLETSAVVAAIVEDDKDADLAVRGEGRRVASSLTFAEARRTIARRGATGRMTATVQRSALARLRRLEENVALVPIGTVILDRVGRPFPVEPLRSLDAIHLATAELLDPSPQVITIVTRDRRLAQNARAMGFVVE